MDVVIGIAWMAMVACAAATVQIKLRRRPQTAREVGWAGAAVIAAPAILAALAGSDALLMALLVIVGLIGLTGWVLGYVLGQVAAQWVLD